MIRRPRNFSLLFLCVGSVSGLCLEPFVYDIFPVFFERSRRCAGRGWFARKPVCLDV